VEGDGPLQGLRVEAQHELVFVYELAVFAKLEVPGVAYHRTRPVPPRWRKRVIPCGGREHGQ
jgi:hypothetical protein